MIIVTGAHHIEFMHSSICMPKITWQALKHYFVWHQTHTIAERIWGNDILYIRHSVGI